jgi:hypothetical protein
MIHKNLRFPLRGGDWRRNADGSLFDASQEKSPESQHVLEDLEIQPAFDQSVSNDQESNSEEE